MKKRLAVLALLTAAVLLLTGCGKIMDMAKSVIGKGEADKPAGTEIPAEIPAHIDGLPPMDEIPTVQPGAEFVGEWVSAVGGDEVTINGDGTVVVNGVAARVTHASKDSIALIAKDWIPMDSPGMTTSNLDGKYYRIDLGSLHFQQGVLYGYPAEEDEDEIWDGGMLYRKGEENPLEPLFGTWTYLNLYDNEILFKGQPVEEVTISPDGQMTVNGESVKLDFFLMDDGLPFFDSSEERVNGNVSMEDDELILWLGLDSDNGRFVRDLKKAELTINNWEDFLEERLVYFAEYDNWGDLQYVGVKQYLAPKQGVKILGFAGDRLETESTPVDFQMLEYNLDTNEYLFREMTDREKEKFGADYFAGLENIHTEGNMQMYTPRDPKRDTDPFTGYGFLLVSLKDDEPVLNGSVATVPAATEFDWKMLRIQGTIFYK